MHRNGINAYRQTDVTTADPLKLVLMCYGKAISNLKTAKEKYAAGEYEPKAKALQKVHDIISLLMQSLDFEKGGAIAENLKSLYTYMMRRLTEGDLQQDLQAFDEVIEMLEELESGWEEISSAPRRDRAADAGSPWDVEEGKTTVAGAY